MLSDRVLMAKGSHRIMDRSLKGKPPALTWETADPQRVGHGLAASDSDLGRRPLHTEGAHPTLAFFQKKLTVCKLQLIYSRHGGVNSSRKLRPRLVLRT